MGYLNVILLAAYALMTCYYIYVSSMPSETCSNPKQCARPLFPSTEIYDVNQQYELEFWTQHEVESQNTQPGSEETNSRRRRKSPTLEWKLLSSCNSSQMSFNVNAETDKSIFKKHKFGGKDNDCTLEFPSFSRVRDTEVNAKNTDPLSSRATIMKAMFVLKKSSTGPPTEENIIAKSVFDLTRLVDFPGKISVPHFKYSRQPIVLRLVVDNNFYPISSPVRGDGLKLMLTHQPSETYGRDFYHRPAFYVDDVALKHSSQIQLAPPEDLAENPRPPVTLTIQLSVISPLRHAIHRQLELGFSMTESFLEPNELDEIRHMISDEYIYRFILTQIITFVHIYLDYMAFRDEIGFYRGKKSMGGVSMSSVLGRFVCQLIIFLYLCDGGNTSWLILGSVGSGVAVEFWKTTKFFQPKITRSFPFISIANTSNMTSLEKDTMNYDRIAHTYLGLILYPIVFGSALYSRKFYTYSSLWSWIISNLANAVYTFGFITLCPQLYVNYRLKSVAHLPMKVFVYKIFNTFVDDVFAFMIEMPLKHKLMTLRDDVVFVIFILQAYIYRVDKSRINEFGYAYEDADAAADAVAVAVAGRFERKIYDDSNVEDKLQKVHVE